jgi:hypothetical protein
MENDHNTKGFSKRRTKHAQQARIRRQRADTSSVHQTQGQQSRYTKWWRCVPPNCTPCRQSRDTIGTRDKKTRNTMESKGTTEREKELGEARTTNSRVALPQTQNRPRDTPLRSCAPSRKTQRRQTCQSVAQSGGAVQCVAPPAQAAPTRHRSDRTAASHARSHTATTQPMSALRVGVYHLV